MLQDLATRVNPLACTTIDPRSCGTPIKTNFPPSSLVVLAEKDPLCRVTAAFATEAPVLSRTTPSTRKACARAFGTNQTRQQRTSPMILNFRNFLPKEINSTFLVSYRLNSLPADCRDWSHSATFHSA